MATLDLYEAKTESEIRLALSRAKVAGEGRDRDNFQLATDYAEGRQLEDVRQELRNRYRQTQQGKRGDDIKAQAIPLTQRFVDEAASAYSKPVKRELVIDETGEKNERTEALTAELQRMVDKASLDETLHTNEENTVLMLSSAVWLQGRAGKLSAEVALPQDIDPIAPSELTWFSANNPDDYAGFAVELFSNTSDESISGRRYAWVEHAQTGFYHGSNAYEPAGSIELFANPYTWPQVVDTDDQRGAEKLLPLNPLTFWHTKKPTGQLIPETDVAIAHVNRELNLQYSILMDTLAHQGWSTLILNVMEPSAPQPIISAGPRNGIALGVGETASMLSSPVNYTDLVKSLHDFVRLIAITLRQSPNDFAVDGNVPTSGFAKLVDSLPKIEARQQRIRRLKAIEQRRLWPRLGAIGSYLGLLSASVEELSKLRMESTFAEPDIPLSIDERIKKEDHEIKHGITTPAALLAKRDGITEEEAEARIAENKAGAQAEPTEPAGVPTGPGAAAASLLGRVVGQR